MTYEMYYDTETDEWIASNGEYSAGFQTQEECKLELAALILDDENID